MVRTEILGFITLWAYLNGNSILLPASRTVDHMTYEKDPYTKPDDKGKPGIFQACRDNQRTRTKETRKTE